MQNANTDCAIAQSNIKILKIYNFTDEKLVENKIK